jgi:hypothetical protein
MFSKIQKAGIWMDNIFEELFEILDQRNPKTIYIAKLQMDTINIMNCLNKPILYEMESDIIHMSKKIQIQWLQQHIVYPLQIFLFFMASQNDILHVEWMINQIIQRRIKCDCLINPLLLLKTLCAKCDFGLISAENFKMILKFAKLIINCKQFDEKEYNKFELHKMIVNNIIDNINNVYFMDNHYEICLEIFGNINNDEFNSFIIACNYNKPIKNEKLNSYFNFITALNKSIVNNNLSYSNSNISQLLNCITKDDILLDIRHTISLIMYRMYNKHKLNQKIELKENNACDKNLITNTPCYIKSNYSVHRNNLIAHHEDIRKICDDIILLDLGCDPFIDICTDRKEKTLTLFEYSIMDGNVQFFNLMLNEALKMNLSHIDNLLCRMLICVDNMTVKTFYCFKYNGSDCYVNSHKVWLYMYEKLIKNIKEITKIKINKHNSIKCYKLHIAYLMNDITPLILEITKIVSSYL